MTLAAHHLAMSLSPRSFVLTSGSADGFAAFQRLVVNDPGLFARLQNTPTTEDFVVLAIELGATHGFTFDADDVRASLQAARCAWIERNLA